MIEKQKIVIAIGGNAINREGEIGTIKEEFRNTRKALNGIIKVIKNGHDVILTHGNGPQAGKFLMRVEAGIGQHIPDRPLGVIVADTQGGIGYMIEQSLINRLKRAGIKKKVATLVTQVVVDKDDPQLKNPSKPVGPFYAESEAKNIIKQRSWAMKEDAGRGWRRVVASPIPLDIVEKDAIQLLYDNGYVVIAAGGGGIPVYYNDKGMLDGVDAVVDKDFASAVLANQIKAETLVIVTGVEKVSINFRQLNQEDLDIVTVSECKQHIKDKQFPAGSMLPKIEAAIRFIENGGKKVIITLPETINEGIKGLTGTHIVADHEKVELNKIPKIIKEELLGDSDTSIISDPA